MKSDGALMIGLGMPKPEAKKKDSDMSEVCVPVSALAAQDEGGAVPPSQGDTVDFNVAAKVNRVEGEKAYLTILKVNGNDLPNAQEEEGEPVDEAQKESDSLRAAAQKEDASTDY